MQKRKIKLYQGFDATGGRLHLGHSVGIRKLMDFANAGHEVIFLFGTGTVLVGDPSQRDMGRKLITRKEVEKNIKNWKDQVSPLVDWSKIKILRNGDWLTKLKLEDIIKIASKISAVQLFKREMFQRRLKQGDTVWYHETMYPLLQGYDSVVMDVDLEIGGTDQEFNMLIGRELLHKFKSKEKFVLTTPMILGTNGKQMSKTARNCIWLDERPQEMYTKLMSLVDNQIVTYMKTVTNISMDRIGEVEKSLKDKSLHPIDAKKELALTVVTELHSENKAKEAQDYFEKTFQKGELPDVEKTVSDKVLVNAVASVVGSKSKAKRLLPQKAIEVNGKVIEDPNYELKGGEIIRVGKKKFVKVE
jgi:tyrosyl-tRNA synthetase